MLTAEEAEQTYQQMMDEIAKKKAAANKALEKALEHWTKTPWDQSPPWTSDYYVKPEDLPDYVIKPKPKPKPKSKLVDTPVVKPEENKPEVIPYFDPMDEDREV